MGLQIGEIVPRRELRLSELKGKIIAVDAYNAIYQFLSSIKQPDGTPLLDSQKRITSHLSGIFYRNVSLLGEGMKLVYVFDGEYHELKGRTQENRGDVKREAREKYEQAKEDEDIDGMRKYSFGFVKFTGEMKKESIELLEAMGIPCVLAPGEGEMQCAKLVQDGEAWAVASQDYDALVVGGLRLIQNLTLSRKRKTVSGYVDVFPEILSYQDVLNELGIDRDQFISLAVLVGTDFNPGGVRGIGPKKALALVRAKRYPVEIFREVEHQIDFDWKKVFEIFKKPNVKSIKLDFPKVDEKVIKDILVSRHDFSMERVEKNLDKLRELRKKGAQRTLF